VLGELGYEAPTPIQAEAIPTLLAGRDVLGQAATGTGKTAAFALPMLQRLLGAEQMGERKPRHARGIIVVPTRELAMQVTDAVQRYGKALGVRVVAIFGGTPFDPQARVLAKGVDIVVATPGRALDHMRRGSLNLSTTDLVAIDEADEMLDMGFAEDLETILAATPAATRQTALFSATLPPRIVAIANKYLRAPAHLRIAMETKRGELPKVTQTVYVVERAHKVATLVRVLEVEEPQLAIVFCRTRGDVEALADALNARGFRVDLLHGGMSQDQRDRAMRKFRDEAIEVLVATDVAARGLDVKGISHVVNFDVPFDPEDYVHRIGRTGRAGREGVAITLIDPRELRLLRNIEYAIRRPIDQAPIPTVAMLRAKKLERTVTLLREAHAAENADRYGSVIEQLAGEMSLDEIATAAIRLVHEANGGAGDEREIPVPRPKNGPRPQQRDDRGPRGGGGDDRRPPQRHDRPQRNDRPPQRDDRPARGYGDRKPQHDADGPPQDRPKRTFSQPVGEPKPDGNVAGEGPPSRDRKHADAEPQPGAERAKRTFGDRKPHDAGGERPTRQYGERRKDAAVEAAPIPVAAVEAPPVAAVPADERPSKRSKPPLVIEMAPPNRAQRRAQMFEAEAAAGTEGRPKRTFGERRPDAPQSGDEPARHGGPEEHARPAKKSSKPPRDLGPTLPLYIGAGDAVGMRPSDLVGAIAGETGLPGTSIGAIRIARNYSLVELPVAQIDTVIEKLRDKPIRGKVVEIKRG